MQKIELPVLVRQTEERAKTLREGKMVPGVVYGHGFQNVHLKMDYQTFRRVFETATFSTLVTLDIDGKQQVPVLIHEVQYDPVTDLITHVDFYAVRMDEKVTTHIAFEFVGASEAVKLGAVLNTNKHQVEVSALPGDLVHTIPVDLTKLEKIGDIIRIKDIVPPKGVEILANPEEPIVSAIELKIIEETPAEAAPAEGATAEGAPAEGAAPAEGEAGKEGGAEAKKKGKE
jgi:large subunit ribosomal protein L25